MKITNIYKTTAALIFLMEAALWPVAEAWGQTTITHKTAGGLWYTNFYQNKYPRTEFEDPLDPRNDTFDDSDEGKTITVNGHVYQKTHTYEMTMYVNSGQDVYLALPSQINGNGDNNSLTYYQRWYDFDQDALITTGSIVPVNQYGYVQNNRGSNYSNGLMGGKFLGNDKTPIWRVRYTAPNNFSSIRIACDASRYTDIGQIQKRRREEPTLSNRAIFTVKNASEIKNALPSSSSDQYYEEYEIHFPTKRISSNTPEQVTLSMDARNYFKWGDDGANAAALSISVNGKIQLDISSISGEDRVIPFTYTERQDGEEATIMVRNGNYNVARFRLIFDANTHGLTQSKITDAEKIPAERTNTYMINHGYANLNTMNFDYKNVSNIQNKELFPYPINWEYSSYAFYGNDNHNAGADDYTPEWGEYSITNYFDGYSGGGSELPGSTYHLFVDASDKPGTIAKIPFRAPLCAGATMYVTAWIKNQAWYETNADASLIFVLKGVNADGTEDVIYRHASGQIPKRRGTNIGDWHQIYFSYVNGSKRYETYLLQLDNNCANSTGGDMCIDDIRVYMNPLGISGQTVEPVCQDDAMAKIRLSLNYELMLKRIGLEDETDKGKATATKAYYCFLDKMIYDATYNGTNYKEAFEAALVEGSGVYPGTESKNNYGVFTFYNNKSMNTGTGDISGMNQDQTMLEFVSEINGNLDDVNSYLHTGRSYYILYNALSFDPNYDLYTQFEKENICTVQGLFRVEGSLVIQGDGTSDIGDVGIPCIGEIPTVRAMMEGADGEPITSVKFDWFFGQKSDFDTYVVENHPEHGLAEALEAFRHFYPDAHSITDEIFAEVGDEKTDDSDYVLHKEDLDLLKELSTTMVGDNIYPVLVLSASNEINPRLQQEETYLVVIPISKKEDEGSGELTKTCWTPTEIILHANGNAPTLDVGFSSLNGSYETDLVSVRMGLKQIQSLQSKQLTIPLRNPLLKDKAVNLIKREDDAGIYLAATTDPDYLDKVLDGSTTRIGEIKSMTVLAESDYDTDRHVQICFASDFAPKEGYSYTMKLGFQLESASTTGECNYGSLLIPILIVPEYQKWIGGRDGNWNRDENWVRSSADELKKNPSAYEPTGEGAQGYAPLVFCKLTIPEEEQIRLYQPERKNNGYFLDLDENDYRPEGMDIPTPHIAYDLVVGGTIGQDLFCRRYYTNVCDQIHFEPQSEILNAERLIYYNRAWVDYQLTGGRWYTLASPLQGVVAGDFYTDSDSGKEMQEYFTDITFAGNGQYKNSTLPNNRFKPSVYQRAWKGKSTEVPLYTDATNTKNVAISGNWSALYNDVAESYTPGMGFSLKVQDLPEPTSGSEAIAKFRLPKADDSYMYYEKDDETGKDASSLERGDNVGKLKTDAFSSGTSSFTVPLQESADGQYYLVGNPFMAHLDMTKFFEVNTDLVRKYWVVTDGNQSAAVGTGDAWVTVDGNSTAKIAPLQSFFVKKNAEAGSNEIKFTQDMQTLGGADGGLRSANALTITATTTDGRTSRAAVAYSGMASDDYQSSEDAELFLDSNLGDVPMVYTVAGTMATSINRTSELYNIPLGVYGNKQEMVTLSFGGLNQFSSATLYDAQEQTETPLHEGKTVSVPAGTSGRYFLRAGTPTGNEVIARNAFLVYSVGGGKVMVTSSNTPLKDIRVYTMGGAQVRSIQASGMQQEIYLNRGIYLITISDQDGLQETRKVLVR